MGAQSKDSGGRKLSMMVEEEDIPLHPFFTEKKEARIGLTAIAGASSGKANSQKLSRSLALLHVPQPHPASYLMPH